MSATVDRNTAIIYEWLRMFEDDLSDGYHWYLKCDEEDVIEYLQIRCRNLAKQISHAEAVNVDSQRRTLPSVQVDGTGQDGQSPINL